MKEILILSVLILSLPLIVAVDNPELPQSCGLDIVLVLDSSGSIDDTELIQMKNAFKDFVDAFLPGTPTEFAVIDFNSEAYLSQEFTDNKEDIKSAINSPLSGGATNWEDALIKVQAVFGGDRAEKPNLIVFASDGIPNRIYPNISVTETEALNAAVLQANNLKQDGVRIVTLAIGDNLNTNNLKAISGPNVNTGDLEVDVITTNFNTLAEDLADYANTLCGGKILIQNQIDKNGDGDASDIGDLDGTESNSELSNWNFEAGEKSGTTNNYGYLELSVDTGTYDVNEIVKSGYTLENAYCEKGLSNIGIFDGASSVDNIFINDEETVMCYFINHFPECIPTSEICDNGADEDCDSLIDCDDDNCGFHENCGSIKEIGYCSQIKESEDDCADGFYTYNWTGEYIWVEGNNYSQSQYDSLSSSVKGNYTFGIDGFWHYDPYRKSEDCALGGTSTIICPEDIKVPFFSLINLLIAILIIAIIYYFIKNKKSRKKKISKKKKKTKLVKNK